MGLITADDLKAVLPQCQSPGAWADALNPAMERFEITTKPRIASFLAQTAHESGQFNRLVESLVFSTTGRLMKVWPKRFPTDQSASPYVNNEAALANFVYANRLGNGDTSSGDGFRFRGRGLIQITGRSNYLQVGTSLGLDLAGNPDLLTQAANAAISAAFFWKSHGLNALADDETDNSDLEDFTEITRRINGGTVGLQERLALLNAFEKQLSA